MSKQTFSYIEVLISLDLKMKTGSMYELSAAESIYLATY